MIFMNRESNETSHKITIILEINNSNVNLRKLHRKNDRSVTIYNSAFKELIEHCLS